jgi:hypothetical protein
LEEVGVTVLSPPTQQPPQHQTLAGIQATLQKAAGAQGAAAAEAAAAAAAAADAAAAAGGVDGVHKPQQVEEEELDGAHRLLGLLLLAGEETRTVPLVLRLFDRVQARFTVLLAVSMPRGGGGRQGVC